LTKFSAPEARGKLAGDGAQRNHRKSMDMNRAPAGAQDQARAPFQYSSGVPAGTQMLWRLSPVVSAAPSPPANSRCASGAKKQSNDFGFYSVRNISE